MSVEKAKNGRVAVDGSVKAVAKREGERVRRRITMKDIAAKTGYTVNTVSHALNDREDISEAAKLRIRAAAEELGYVGDSLAGSLRTGITKTVAVIIGDVSNPHFAILVKELDSEAARGGYCTIILNTDENPDKELSAVKTAIGRKVDGIIICPTQKRTDGVRFLKKHGVPYVLLGRHDGVSDCVVSDDENGGYIAAKSLIAKGHKQILFLGGNSCISSARERKDGFQRAVREAGIDLPDSLICEPQDGGIADTLISLREQNISYSAIVAFSDIMAFEAVRFLSEVGINVPKDVEIVGFDNIQKSMPFIPPICSVEASESMAVLAFSLLKEKIDGVGGAPKQIIIPPRIITR